MIQGTNSSAEAGLENTSNRATSSSVIIESGTQNVNSATPVASSTNSTVPRLDALAETAASAKPLESYEGDEPDPVQFFESNAPDYAFDTPDWDDDAVMDDLGALPVVPVQIQTVDRGTDRIALQPTRSVKPPICNVEVIDPPTSDGQRTAEDKLKSVVPTSFPGDVAKGNDTAAGASVRNNGSGSAFDQRSALIRSVMNNATNYGDLVEVPVTNIQSVVPKPINVHPILKAEIDGDVNATGQASRSGNAMPSAAVGGEMADRMGDEREGGDSMGSVPGCSDSLRVKIKIRDDNGEETQFTMYRTTKLGKLFRAWATRTKATVEWHRFLFDGVRCDFEKTPNFYLMEDLDVIDAKVSQIGGGNRIKIKIRGSTGEMF